MLRANLKLSLLLAGAIATTQVPVQAFDTNVLLPTAIGCGAVSAFLLSTKESDPNFKSRFNGSMVRNVRKMTTKEYYQNLWYLFWDEFIGQKSKSSKVKANKEDGSLEWSQKAPSAGICGKTCDYLKSLKDADGSLKALALLGGAYIWVNKNFLGVQEPKKEKEENLEEKVARLERKLDELEREKEKIVTKIYSDGPINVTVQSRAQVESDNTTETSANDLESTKSEDASDNLPSEIAREI